MCREIQAYLDSNKPTPMGATMNTIYSYTCSTYPGMETCPGRFRAASKDELWKLIELHASVAHGEDPVAWTLEDKAQIETLINIENE